MRPRSTISQRGFFRLKLMLTKKGVVMKTALGYNHKLIYHIFKNLEFIVINKGYEPLYLPSWSSTAEEPSSQTASLLSPSGKLIHFYSDPTPLVRQIALRRKIDTPQSAQKYFYHYFFPRADNSLSEGFEQGITAGFEYFNDPSAEADAEIIKSCLELVTRLELGRVHLEIGHAGFTEGFITELRLPSEAEAKLRLLFEQKNQSAIENFAQKYELSKHQIQAIKELQNCFGPLDIVLQKTKNLSCNTAMKSALEELNDLTKHLGHVNETIHLDLGFSNSQCYYTGPVFRIYSHVNHQAIFTGGRYDSFEKDASTNLAACGANLLFPNILEVIMMNYVNSKNQNVKIGSRITLVEDAKSNAQLTRLKSDLECLGLSYTSLSASIPNSLKDIQLLLEKNPALRWLVYCEGEDTLQVIDKAYNQSYKTTAKDLVSLLMASNFESAIH